MLLRMHGCTYAGPGRRGDVVSADSKRQQVADQRRVSPERQHGGGGE